MKLLLVRLSSMGDLIHTFPAITDLARHRPEIELHWLCEAAFADIARLHPFVQQVHEMRWRAWRKHLFQAATWQQIHALKQNLRQVHFQQVIDSQGLMKSALFARMAGAPIIGFNRNSAREPFAARFYQRTIAVAKGQDAVWRNRLLFAHSFDYEPKGAPDFGAAAPCSGSLNGLPERYYVALHATSRDSKLWRNDFWQTLLQRLHKRDGADILLPWGNPAERERARYIAANLPFVHVCPPLSLRQAADLLHGAQAVVGVDTGLLHLANALNRPLVGIYTDSDPDKTGVQSTAHSINLGGIGQMPDVESVYRALERAMAFQAA